MKYWRELTTAIEEIVRRWEIPGMAVGVIDKNEVVHSQLLGIQSVASPSPVTLETRFCMASVSKPFAAVAVMQLAERGQIHLDAPVLEYVPFFSLRDPRYRRITVRHLLSHTSGIPDMSEHEYAQLWRNPEHDAGAAERLVRSLQSRPMVADPGEVFSYSNLAYNLLGVAIARVTGMSFESYVAEHVLAPIEMGGSSFLLEDIAGDSLAMPHLRAPHVLVNPVYPYHRADAPSSNLHSSLRDMLRWAMSCLDRSRRLDLLRPVSFESMWTPVIKRGGIPIYEHMGLGWNLGSYKGHPTVSHMGAGAGFNAFLILLPEESSGAVAMLNTESQAVYRVLWAVLDALLGEEPKAKSISWMIPISEALSNGGYDAAYSRYCELKECDPQTDVFIEPSSLTMLAMQLLMVGNSELAAETLRLNVQVFPEDVDSYVTLSRAYAQGGQMGHAHDALLKALALAPDHPEASALRDELMNRSRPHPES